LDTALHKNLPLHTYIVLVHIHLKTTVLKYFINVLLNLKQNWCTRIYSKPIMHNRLLIQYYY